MHKFHAMVSFFCNSMHVYETSSDHRLKLLAYNYIQSSDKDYVILTQLVHSEKSETIWWMQVYAFYQRSPTKTDQKYKGIKVKIR